MTNTTFICSHASHCTIPEESFLDGMNWGNYGAPKGWHVDHIRPCASFNLSDPEQQGECFHYTNLQPLWAKDNIKKQSWWNGKHHRHGSNAI